MRLDTRLSKVRDAIRGWAFAPNDWLPSMIRRAEEIRDTLPLHLHEEANEIIRPVVEVHLKNEKERMTRKGFV